METLLAVTLAAQLGLHVFSFVSFAAPRHRTWPPPSRGSWQFCATWFLSWVTLSGVLLLAVLDENSLGLPRGLRLGLGATLFGLAASLLLWAFRALSLQTTLGLGGRLVRTGPYRWSRNPQRRAVPRFLGLPRRPLAA
jgi:protein-S-isoprenylcysteine O-methyltransferase Ste14